MNLILIKPSEINLTRVVLNDERAKHISRVLRASIGDEIRVGVVDEMLGHGVVNKIHRRPPYAVELELSIDTLPPPPSPIDIVLALPRPIMLKRVLSQATTLGVKQFHIINARRVEKSFWDSQILGREFYRKHLISGLEQAIDTKLPNVSFHKGFRSFVETEIVKIKQEYTSLVVADPSFKKRPAELKHGPERTLLAVGPEGGWVDYELKKMEQAGFTGFGIGTRILRVDSAVIALHSMLTMLPR